jgi:hypothetical protein
MALSRRDAAQEYWRRRQLRRSLVNFARERGFEPAPHHKLIIDHLEKVARGEVDRLIITAPPGSAKSTYVSVLFPAWLLANNKRWETLVASIRLCLKVPAPVGITGVVLPGRQSYALRSRSPIRMEHRRIGKAGEGARPQRAVAKPAREISSRTS